MTISKLGTKHQKALKARSLGFTVIGPGGQVISIGPGGYANGYSPGYGYGHPGYGGYGGYPYGGVVAEPASSCPAGKKLQCVDIVPPVVVAPAPVITTPFVLNPSVTAAIVGPKYPGYKPFKSFNYKPFQAV